MNLNLKLNEIKLIPYQCKRILKYRYFVCIGRFYHAKQRYFFVFCLVEEVYLVVN